MPVRLAPMNSDGTANVVPFPSTTVKCGIDDTLTEVAQQVRMRAAEKWGINQSVELVGTSSRMRDTLDRVQKFARFNQTILITGESGVGKELFAKACYLLSARTKAPFVVVNCPQYGEGNVTVSELFGHVKGSFTGAISDHKGLFNAADGGAVFLDEVGDLPPTAQTMLLRALAEKEVKPLGSNKTYSVDVRVIAATNRPLRDMLTNGQFRQDLYFRLRYFPLDIPALRERAGSQRQLSPDERSLQYQAGPLPEIHGFPPTPSSEAGGVMVGSSRFTVSSSRLAIRPKNPCRSRPLRVPSTSLEQRLKVNRGP
jgi:DNA-binding NtrC family response regulator